MSEGEGEEFKIKDVTLNWTVSKQQMTYKNLKNMSDIILANRKTLFLTIYYA
ncbi:MAG: hypothetical protein GX892_08600 [Thermoanaerobacteraceae bacterium]|nr:hypothetical protein [Thermoanaerobacteraceae bacterium]